MDERMTKVLTKLDSLGTKDSGLTITYGQLTAIATTSIGQSVGLGQIINEEDRMMIEAIKQQANMQDLEESMIGNSIASSNSSFKSARGEPSFETMSNINSSMTQDRYLEHVKRLEK